MAKIIIFIICQFGWIDPMMKRVFNIPHSSHFMRKSTRLLSRIIWMMRDDAGWETRRNSEQWEILRVALPTGPGRTGTGPWWCFPFTCTKSEKAKRDFTRDLSNDFWQRIIIFAWAFRCVTESQRHTSLSPPSILQLNPC